MSRFKDLAKNTAIIAIGKISTQFITFLLLPLYTSLLATNEYGIVDLVLTVVQLAIPIASLMLDQGVFRYLLTCKNELDKKRHITSAILLQTILNVIYIIAYFVSTVFVYNKYIIWVFLIVIVMTYSNLFLQIARGLKKTAQYTIGSFICSTTTILLNVVFLVSLKMGTMGMIKSVFYGNLLCSLYLFFILKIYSYLSVRNFKFDIIKSQIQYSIPLIPNQISLWVMNSSDRFIVTLFLGTAANGILAISHKFPTIFMTFYFIFQLAWHESGTIHYNDKDRDQFFSQAFDIVFSIFSIICLMILLFLPLIFDLLINKNFFESYYNIPIYLVAFLFNVVIGYLGVIYIATKKTSEIAKTTILAAVINIIVHLLLVKPLLLFAASISTFVSYMVTMIYRLADSKKYISIKYNYKRISALMLLLIISSIVYYFKNNVISIISILVIVPLTILFNKDSVNSIIMFVKEKIKR